MFLRIPKSYFFNRITSYSACLFFSSPLTYSISSQTITWMQPPKAGPARTSSDPPDCPPTLLSHTPSQSPTTTHTPAPRRVGNIISLNLEWRAPIVTCTFFISHWTKHSHRSTVLYVTLCCHIYSLTHSVTAFHSELYIQGDLFYVFLSQPIGCREDASRQEEMKRVGVTVFKE